MLPAALLLRAEEPSLQLSTMASAVDAASGKPPILLLRRLDPPFATALRERFRVFDLYASGEPLPAFLAAAPDPRAPPSSWAAAPYASTLRSSTPFPLCAVSSAKPSALTASTSPSALAAESSSPTNSGKVYSADVIDHAVGMLIDVLRRVSAAEQYVRRGLRPVRGAYPLGSKLSAASSATTLEDQRIQSPTNTPQKFMILLLNKETRHVVDKDVLEVLGKNGIVINIGRGGNMDEPELAMALKEGRIAGAGRDVFESEPKVPAELLSMDNVVLTPHIAVNVRSKIEA